MKKNILALSIYSRSSIALALFGSLVSAQADAQSGSIVGSPAAKQYLPFGSFVPAMVLRTADGVTIDRRTDRARVRHFWKAFKHRLVPTPYAEIPQTGYAYVTTFWNIPTNWTGNVDGCDPGKIDVGIQEATIRQVNWYRSMIGLMPLTNGGPDKQLLAQRAALVNLANPSTWLTHSPAPSAKCYSADTAFAAGVSNLALLSALPQGTTTRGPGTIDAYMDDGGPSNYGVGHRRHHIHPRAASMAYGETMAPSPPGSDYPLTGVGASAVQIPQFEERIAPSEVLWPAPGYLPYQAYPTGNRWSLSCDGCDFVGATVAMKRNGVDISTRIEANFDYFLDQKTLVWEAQGVNYRQYEPWTETVFRQDEAFDVTVNYGQNGVAKTTSFRTIVFNPEVDEDFVPTFDITDHYWVPTESGWGMNLTQASDGNIFGAVYFYDEQGNQRWMTIQGGWTAKNVFSGKLYTTRGPGFNSVPFNPSEVTVFEAGQGKLTFSPDTQSVQFDFAIGNQVASKQMVRYGNIPVAFGNGANYRGMWWNASESGWGLTIQHDYNTLFISWFTYNPDGSQLWVTMQGNWTDETTFAGKLYTTTQQPWKPQSFDPSATQVSEMGVGKLIFQQANRAIFEYTLKGETGRKLIEKFEF